MSFLGGILVSTVFAKLQLSVRKALQLSVLHLALWRGIFFLTYRQELSNTFNFIKIFLS